MIHWRQPVDVLDAWCLWLLLASSIAHCLISWFWTLYDSRLFLIDGCSCLWCSALFKLRPTSLTLTSPKWRRYGTLCGRHSLCNGARNQFRRWRAVLIPSSSLYPQLLPVGWLWQTTSVCDRADDTNLVAQWWDSIWAPVIINSILIIRPFYIGIETISKLFGANHSRLSFRHRWDRYSSPVFLQEMAPERRMFETYVICLLPWTGVPWSAQAVRSTIAFSAELIWIARRKD